MNRIVFSSLVLGNLRGNAVLSAVTVFAVALGVAIGLAIDLANATAVRSFASSVNIVANHVNLQVLGIGRPFDERTLLHVQSLGGVQSATPAIEGSIVVGANLQDPFSGDVIRVLGLDVVRPLPQESGNTVDAPDQGFSGAGSGDLATMIDGHGALISSGLAQRYHLRAGSELDALAGDKPVRLRVVAVVPPSSGVDSSSLFVDIATAQELFGKVGSLDRIDLIVAPDRLHAVERTLRGLLPPGVRAIEPRVRSDEIKRMLRSFAFNLTALAYVALLVGMYLIYNTVAISVVQRKAEIGTLRGLGATRRQILAAFLAEGALLGVAGSLAGLALGAVLAQFSVAAVSRTVDSLYIGSHADRVLYDPLVLLKAFLFGVVFAIVAAAIPALGASRAAPALSMRAHGIGLGTTGRLRWLDRAGLICLIVAALVSRLPAVDGIPLFGYLSGLCVIAGFSLLTPRIVEAVAALADAVSARVDERRAVALKLAAANLRASVRRNAVAVAALMTSVAMVTSVAILIASFRTTIAAWSNESLRADLFARPLGLADASDDARFSPGVAQRIGAVPGVAAVDTFRAITVPFQGALTTVAATNFSALAQRERLRMLSGDSIASVAARAPAANEVLASDPFTVRFGVRAGDRIALDTPGGRVNVRIAGVYNDYSSDAGVLLMDAGTFARLYHDDSVNSLAIYARPGVDLLHLRSSVIRSVEPLRIDVRSNRELRAFVIQVFNRTFAITYALDAIAIVVAALGVVSTLFALVLERRGEIALLRYLGLAAAGVRNMILTEAAYIGATAAVLGVVVGFTLGLLLVYVINRQAFGWLIELHVPWLLLFEVMLAVTVTAVCAALYPAWVAARIRTADALRAE